MNDKVELNQNFAECIKKATHWGETVYTNVCNGSASVVAWGSMDYLSEIAGIVLALIACALMACIVGLFMRMMRDI